MFGRALTRAFWVLYDNLFKSILLNAIFFLSYLAIFLVFWQKKMYFVTIILFIFIWHMLAPPIVSYFARMVTEGDRDKLFVDIGRTFSKLWLKSLALFGINTGAAFLFYLAFVYYKQYSSNIFALIAGGIGLWMAATFLLMQFYLIPIFVMDEKARIFTSYKKSAIMLLSAPFSTIGLGMVVVYFTALAWPLLLWLLGPHANTIAVYITMFPIFLFPFFTFAIIQLLQVNATVLMYEKYKILPDLRERWEGRTWAGLIRPWDGK
ncbi:MAG: hypothetical protein LLG37_03370 [Spirochaetia bacterium]|nr:hypothetical protein [Spirochaetia bacterium]